MTTSGVCGFVSGLLLVYAVRGAVGCGSWTLQQATNCVAVASSSDILSGAQFNTASLTQACQNLSEAVSCVDNYQSACSSSSQYASLRSSIYNLNAIQCGDVMYCLAALATCDQSYPGVSALTPDFSNSDYCQAVLPLISCAQNALEPVCAVVSNISYYENLWQDVEFACQHVTCASLGQCITQVELSTFTVGQSGLDHNTCLAYSTYASCLQTALPQCSHSIRPVGQPEAASIARYITEGCTLMSDAGVIYTCAEFSTCFENFIGNVSEFSPQELCNVVQGTLGCAVSNAAACAVPSHEVFIRDTNNFMLYIGDRGCGFPQPELSSCTAFTDCLDPMVSMFMLQPRPPLVEVCSTLATFQQCAHDMKTSCSLRNSVGPDLGQVASLTRRICTVIGDLSMGTCSQFASCIHITKPPPFNGATLSTFQWCKLTMTVLQCTLTYSNVCNISDSARPMIMDIYVDAVKVGCTNVYRLTVPPENGANRVTGCAALWVAVHLLVIRHLLHSPPGA